MDPENKTTHSLDEQICKETALNNNSQIVSLHSKVQCSSPKENIYINQCNKRFVCLRQLISMLAGMQPGGLGVENPSPTFEVCAAFILNLNILIIIQKIYFFDKTIS